MRRRGLFALGLMLLLQTPIVPIAGGAEDLQTGERAARADEPWWDGAWQCRVPVRLDNSNNTKDLFDYQIYLEIPYDSEMRSDFSDLRFVHYLNGSQIGLTYWFESVETGKLAKVFVRLGYISAQNVSIMHVYYGNPTAESLSDASGTFDLFEDFNGGALDSSKWNDPHYQDGGVTASVSGGMLDFDVRSGYDHTGGCVISKVLLPTADYVVETKVKFTDYYQSALGAYAGFTDSLSYDDSYYGRPTKLVSARLWDYTRMGGYLALSADDMAGTSGSTQITVRNTWFKMKTCYTPTTYAKAVFKQLENPFAQQSLECSGQNGIPPNYLACGIGDYITAEHTYFDWLLLHKYTNPEPNATLGKEERPYRFRSMSFSPKEPSENDQLTLTASVENPTSRTGTAKVSFHLGEQYNASEAITPPLDVILKPDGVTDVNVKWTARGGNNTAWCALFGEPVGSVQINVNRDPKLERVKDQQVAQDTELRLLLNASDADGDALIWSIKSDIASLIPTGERAAELTCIPTNEQIGSHQVNVSVVDPHNRSVSQLFKISVQNVNDPPAIDPVPAQTATQHREFRCCATASDPDLRWGDELAFSDDTTLFDIDRVTGDFAFTPGEDDVGRHRVTITVTDFGGLSSSSAFDLTVVNVNDPPVIEEIIPQVALQGRLFQYKANATDPDMASDPNERLRFSEDSPLMEMDAGTGMMGFTPSNDDVGVQNATITVTDKGGLSSSTLLTVTVVNANDPPRLEAILDQLATEDQPFQFQCNATDPDLKWGEEALTYSDNTDLFAIDPRTGLFGFTPTGKEVGSFRITITVRDRSNAAATSSFTLTVQHVNHAPTGARIVSPADGASFEEGAAVYLEGTAKDVDTGDNLEYEWFVDDEPSGIGKNISVTLKPGRHFIGLEVTDGSESDRAMISVQVLKKEERAVSVAGNDGWMYGAAIAAVAAGAGVGFMVLRRRRRTDQAAAGTAGGAVGAHADAAGEPAPAPPPVASPEGQEVRDEARRIIDSSVEQMADIQDAHPEEALDMSGVMDDLELAREFMKSGDYAEALNYAKAAEAAVLALKSGAPPPRVVPPEAPSEVAAAGATQEANEPALAASKCAECGEEMQPEWAACPVCGHRG